MTASQLFWVSQHKILANTNVLIIPRPVSMDGGHSEIKMNINKTRNYLEVIYHKRKAKHICLSILRLRDNYDCGDEMIDTITCGRLTFLKVELDRQLDILNKIDIDCSL